MKNVKLASVASTNKYCEALDLMQVEDFTCFWALEQTSGVGQRGNVWHAAPGENLSVSLVLHPTFLPAERQFRLTQILSLAVVDFLAAIDPSLHTSIKWPNDIVVDGKKICGMLTSTRLQGNSLAAAVCGIGININETEFPAWVPHPTSLALLTGHHYDLESLLNNLLHCTERRYNALRAGNTLRGEYLSHLLNYGVEADYLLTGTQYPQPTPLRATITGVDIYGHLLLTAADGRRHCCAMKEIALVSAIDA